MRTGGVGSAVSQYLRDCGMDLPVRNIGVPDAFLAHAKRDDLLKELGINAQDVSRMIVETVAVRTDEPATSAQQRATQQ